MDNVRKHWTNRNNDKDLRKKKSIFDINSNGALQGKCNKRRSAPNIVYAANIVLVGFGGRGDFWDARFRRTYLWKMKVGEWLIITQYFRFFFFFFEVSKFHIFTHVLLQVCGDKTVSHYISFILPIYYACRCRLKCLFYFILILKIKKNVILLQYFIHVSNISKILKA